MKRSIVIVGCGSVLLALAGCSGDDSTPAKNSAAGGGQGGDAAQAGSAGQAEAGQGGGTGGGNQVAGAAGSSGGGGASGSEMTDASTTTKDAAISDGADLDAGDWKVLFNGKDLSNWTSSVGQGQNAASTAIYTVATVPNVNNGEPVIWVYPTQADQSDQPQATLRTKESYSNYIFHAEYMWGTKRFGGRKQTDRDNGICFHINGSNQDIVWPQGLEFQIGSQAWPGDWVFGNIFTLANGASRFKWTSTMQNGQQVYSPNGTQTTVSGTYTRALTDKQRNANPPMWNVLELTVHGATDATYTVNGEVANKLTNMEWNNNGTWTPLDHGPIALQAEFAELYFRNVRIQVLP